MCKIFLSNNIFWFLRKVRKNELFFHNSHTVRKKSYVTLTVTSFLRQKTIYNVSKKAVKLRQDELYKSKRYICSLKYTREFKKRKIDKENKETYSFRFNQTYSLRNTGEVTLISARVVFLKSNLVFYGT